MNQTHLLEALELGEDRDREYKSARGGLPRSLWETYSAMANTEGGVIVLGVKEKSDGRFEIQGLPDSELPKLKSDFWSTINNRGHVSVNLLSDRDLEVATVSQKRVIIISVPMATRYRRPVFLGTNPMTGTYRRNFEGDYRCSETEVRGILMDASEEPPDSRILEHFDFDDIDLDTLMQYRNRFSARSSGHTWLSEDPEGLFRKLGGWRRDRTTGKEGITVAGLLMFGTHSAITAPEAVPGFHLDYQEQLSDDPAVRWTDRITFDGTWECNIFQFYQRVMPRLTVDLKIPFQLDSELFRKDETVVHEAIREAVVNALIHADYFGQGGVLIIRRRDGFELSNPGTLLLSLRQIISGGISECRNKTLQKMFAMIGGGEKAGSGVDKIRQGWKSQHWRWPWLITTTAPNRVRWNLPTVSLLSDKTLKYLQELFGSRFESLSEIGRMALALAYEEGGVTNPRLQQDSTMHSADISRELKSLVKSKFLKQSRSGRWAEYRLPDHSPSLPHKEPRLPDKEPILPHKASSKASEELAAEELTVLRGKASEARRLRRLPPEKTQEIIVLLCRDHYLTAERLADLLNRKVKTIRTHVGKMVKEEKLFRRYPQDPTRSDQAYTSNSDLKKD